MQQQLPDMSRRDAQENVDRLMIEISEIDAHLKRTESPFMRNLLHDFLHKEIRGRQNQVDEILALIHSNSVSSVLYAKDGFGAKELMNDQTQQPTERLKMNNVGPFPILLLPQNLGASVLEFLTVQECCRLTPTCANIRKFSDESLKRPRKADIVSNSRDETIIAVGNRCPRLQSFLRRTFLPRRKYVHLVPFSVDDDIDTLLRVNCTKALRKLCFVLDETGLDDLGKKIPDPREAFPQLETLKLVFSTEDVSPVLRTLEKWVHVQTFHVDISYQGHMVTEGALRLPCVQKIKCFKYTWSIADYAHPIFTSHTVQRYMTPPHEDAKRVLQHLPPDTRRIEIDTTLLAACVGWGLEENEPLVAAAYDDIVQLIKKWFPRLSVADERSIFGYSILASGDHHVC